MLVEFLPRLNGDFCFYCLCVVSGAFHLDGLLAAECLFAPAMHPLQLSCRSLLVGGHRW